MVSILLLTRRSIRQNYSLSPVDNNHHQHWRVITIIDICVNIFPIQWKTNKQTTKHNTHDIYDALKFNTCVGVRWDDPVDQFQEFEGHGLKSLTPLWQNESPSHFGVDTAMTQDEKWKCWKPIKKKPQSVKYKEVSDWGPGWVWKEAQIKSDIIHRELIGFQAWFSKMSSWIWKILQA